MSTVLSAQVQSSSSAPPTPLSSLPHSPSAVLDVENNARLANMSHTPPALSSSPKEEQPAAAPSSSDPQPPLPSTAPPESGKEEKALPPPSSSAVPVPPVVDLSYMDAMDATALLELGRGLMSSKEWGLACEALSRCVERAASAYGDQSLEVAPLYRHYGRALFEHWRSNQSALGEKIKEAQGGDGRVGQGAGGLIGEEDEVEDADGESGDAAPAAAPHGDDDAAWEVLDLARLIYTRHFVPPSDASSSSSASPASSSPSGTAASSSSSFPSSSTSTAVPGAPENEAIGLALASVLLLLGDLHQEQEQWAQAYQDYQQSLALQQQFLPLPHRDIASTHTELAVCALYQGQPAQALVHYTQAHVTLQYHLLFRIASARRLVSPSSSFCLAELYRVSEDAAEEKRLLEQRVLEAEAVWKADEESGAASSPELDEERKAMAECREWLQDMRERIDEMKQEMTKAVTAESATAPSAAPGVAVDGTSTGFLASPFAVPTLSFGPSASSFAQPTLSSSASSTSAPAFVSHGSLKRPAENDAAPLSGGTDANGDNDTAVSQPQVKRKKQSPP